jgi:hypothetical protein
MFVLVLASFAISAFAPQASRAADDNARIAQLEARLANLDGRLAALELAKSGKHGMMMDHGSGMSGSSAQEPMGQMPQAVPQMPPASGGMDDM